MIGVVSDATLRDFNNKINSEHALYASTPVGKSDAGELGRFGADFLMFYIAPAGVGARGFKLMSIGAISGSVIYGIQPVYHGALTDRGINTLIGAVSGSLMLPVAKAISHVPRYVLPLFKGRKNINRSVAGEVFNIQSIEENLGKDLGYGGGSYEKVVLFSRNSPIDFAPSVFKDAQLYPIEKMPYLGNYLRRHDVDFYPVEYLPKGDQFPGFTSCWERTGRPALFLPQDPTVLEVKHELSHFLDFKRLGRESYDMLSTYQKEQMVLDRLKNNRVWNDLTIGEKLFSEKYVTDELSKDLSKKIR